MDNNNYEQETKVEETQPNNNQQSYNQPNYSQQNYGGPNLEPPMTLGDWIITLLVLAIPCVGIVMYFVWGFGQGGNTSRKNYCRAALIFAVAGIVLGIVLWFILFAIVGASFGPYMGEIVF